MNLTVKHIIWDWNGTLLNDVWFCVEVMNEIRQKRKMSYISELAYRELFDFPVKDYYQKIGFDFDKETFESIGTDFMTLYDERQSECLLHQGAKQMLRQLFDAGISHSALSARHINELKKGLEFYKIDTFFSEIAGLDDHYANGKEELGKKLIARLPYPKDEIIMVGDTTHDYEVAQAMGVKCYLISHGHQTRNRLEECKNAIIVDDLSEILSYCNPA